MFPARLFLLFFCFSLTIFLFLFVFISNLRWAPRAWLRNGLGLSANSIFSSITCCKNQQKGNGCFPYHRSTFWPINGMAFISERIHRNSPRMVMSPTQIPLVIHHQKVWGTYPFTTQQPIKWPRWTVAAKSRHCLVRPTTYHIMKALQKQNISLVNIF